MTKSNESNSAFLKYRGTFRKSSKNDDKNDIKFIATSTGLSHVLIMILLTVCRKLTIDVPMGKRLFTYFCLIIFGGIICDFAPILVRAFVPFKISKEGVLHNWFTMQLWCWALAILIPFLYMTNEIVRLTPSQADSERLDEWISRSASSYISEWNRRYVDVTPRDKVLRLLKNEGFIRLIINLILIRLALCTFTWVTKVTGACSISMLKEEEPCLRLGHRWAGFIIDETIFQLLIVNLIILEEGSLMRGWEPFGEQLSIKQKIYRRHCKLDNSQWIAWNAFNVYIRFLFIALTIISFLIDFMVFQYTLHYSTMVSKAAAFGTSLFIWFISYRNIYRSSVFISLIRFICKH